MVSLAVGVYASASAPYFLLVDAECWAWPRPLAAVERSADRLLATVPGTRLVMAAHRVHTASRDVCRDAAALLILLLTSPKGAMA